MQRNKQTQKKNGAWIWWLVRKSFMDSKRLSGFVFVSVFVLLLLCNTCSVRAGDIVHDDENAPKKPGCENDFVLVCSDAFINGFCAFQVRFLASIWVPFCWFGFVGFCVMMVLLQKMVFVRDFEFPLLCNFGAVGAPKLLDWISNFILFFLYWHRY